MLQSFGGGADLQCWAECLLGHDESGGELIEEMKKIQVILRNEF